MEAIRTTTNTFGARVIEAAYLTQDPTHFSAQLAFSVDDWRKAGVGVAWIELSTEFAPLVPVAVRHGFEYHSVSDGLVRMVLRLNEDAYIPSDATHYIGAGGVVIRNDDELLVVSERYRRSGGRHLKLPGGALHPGEHIVDAVRREIVEETGIETRFRSLVCFRHWHGYRYGKSDIYFVCRLDPVSFDLDCQEEEIEECLWMPVTEFLAAEEVHQFNRRIVRAALSGDGIALEVLPGYGTPETHEIFMPCDGD